MHRAFAVGQHSSTFAQSDGREIGTQLEQLTRAARRAFDISDASLEQSLGFVLVGYEQICVGHCSAQRFSIAVGHETRARLTRGGTDTRVKVDGQAGRDAAGRRAE